MKIALIDIPSDGRNLIYKDWAGGCGTAFRVGKSLRARFLQMAKKTGIHLPLPAHGYLAAILRQCGHEVAFHHRSLPDTADIV
ncbi:MAG: hypothetical protein JW941_10570, partial [Candidatus Coatesbacteria bacterium]|nr:hypothetical protein [Candidatus Coatesbacteria bacterium]